MNFNLVPLLKYLQLQSLSNFNLTMYLVGNSTKGSLVVEVKCLHLQPVRNFNLTMHLVGNSTKGSLVGEVGNHQSGVDNGGNVVFGS